MNAVQEVIERDNETIRVSKIEGVNMQSLHDFMVMAFNNETTDATDVVSVFMKECDYKMEQATSFTYKVHTLGKAVVFWGPKAGCEGLVKALANILVQSEVLKNE